MAQWIRRWSTKPEIPGSTPGRIEGLHLSFSLFVSSFATTLSFGHSPLHVSSITMGIYSKALEAKASLLARSPSFLYAYGVSLPC